MSSFSAWWDALTAMQKIYWCIAIPFSLLMIVQLIMTFAGSDADTDIDTEAGDHHDGDEGGEFQIFTIKNFIVFFTVLGWGGLGFLEMGMAGWLSMVLASVIGFIAMLIMASILYSMSKLVDSGTLKMRNAIGRNGEVYLRIPANKGGIGKITLNVQGSLRELDAITTDTQDIPSGSLVMVVDVINGNILLVTKQIV
jgi:hypothetical protein